MQPGCPARPPPDPSLEWALAAFSRKFEKPEWPAGSLPSRISPNSASHYCGAPRHALPRAPPIVHNHHALATANADLAQNATVARLL